MSDLTQPVQLRQSIKLRAMTIYDIPEVYKIGEGVFTTRSNIFLYRTWDAYEVTGLFSTDPALCIVATMASEIIGFALGSTIEKPRSPWIYGYLVWTAVKPQFQRYKVGKRLYREVEKRARKHGARIMIVDTEGTNLPALSFFTKLGFTKGSPHVWMTKSLTGSSG
jgi:ribosomal protein S18 acetylase RimI-like enzyme